MVPPDGGGLKYSDSALFSAAFAMIYRVLDFNFLRTPDNGPVSRDAPGYAGHLKM